MRLARLVLAFLFCTSFIPYYSSAQTSAATTTASDPQAVQLLQRSQLALTGGNPLSDATLSGTARRIAGSDNQTGSGILKAISTGASRVDLNLTSGQRTEIHNASSKPPAGSWSGPDRVSYPIAFHNLLTEPSWFFPAFAVARSLSPSGYVATYAGRETHNGVTVEHVSVSQTWPSSLPRGPVSFEHLTQVDFFLDANTLLPAAIGFNIHPDKNALLDIPIEVRFADYRAIAGARLPYHVQKYLNNGLIFDFQADSATLNIGLTVGQVTAQ